MVDLKAKPFYLTDEEIKWVEDTLSSMTPDEKLSQLFVLLKAVPGVDEAQIRALMESAQPGGMRWQGGDKEPLFSAVQPRSRVHRRQLRRRRVRRTARGGHLRGHGSGSRRL